MLLVHAALLNVSKAGMISIHLCQLRNKYYMWFNTYYLKVTCLRYDFIAGLTEINLCLSCTATEGCKFPKDSLVLLYKFSSTSSATPAAGVLVSIFFFSLTLQRHWGSRAEITSAGTVLEQSSSRAFARRHMETGQPPRTPHNTIKGYQTLICTQCCKQTAACK